MLNSILAPLLAPALALATATLASPGFTSDGLQVDNLRFLDDEGALTFAADGPLPARSPGTLKMELVFRVGVRDARGLFPSTPLRVAWANDDGPWKELGFLPSAPFARVDPLTGRAVATLTLPLRRGDENALPLLTTGDATLRLAVAPLAEEVLDHEGGTSAAAASTALELEGWIPDVWVGTPLYSDTQLVGADTDFYVHLREPASSERVLDLDVEPRGGVTLSTTQLIVPPGGGSAEFQVAGSASGSFQVLVFEDGVEVARSGMRRVDAGLGVTPLLGLGEQGMENAVQAVISAKNLFKRCKPAIVLDGKGANVEVCGECGISAAERGCRAEGGSPVGIAHPGKCTFGLDECYLFVTSHDAGTYQYLNKRVVECGQVILTPFGSGFSITYYQTCCSYKPIGGTGKIFVQDCH